MKALVLAGGYPQITLIKKLKAMGYYVILADWNEHPIAERYADKFYCKSTLDISAIEKIAVSEKVDLIITVCTDQALNTVATISEKLDLPCYISSETGRNVTNKRYMKNVFCENMIPTANYTIVNNSDKPSNIVKYPVIIKPVDCNSSKGVVKVYNDNDLSNAIKNAITISRTGEAIIEEYIDGRELSIDAIVCKGIVQILCISEIQKSQENGKFIICRSILPAKNIDTLKYEKIRIIAQKIADAFGLLECPLLIQAIDGNDTIKVIEFSARTGGGEKYKSIQWYTGVDIIQATINQTLGIKNDIIIEPNSQIMLNEFIYCYEGIIDSYFGFTEILNTGTITNFELYRKKGQRIDNANNSGDRAASITIVADNYSELMFKYTEAMKKIRIYDKDNNDLIRHDFVLNP